MKINIRGSFWEGSEEDARDWVEYHVNQIEKVCSDKGLTNDGFLSKRNLLAQQIMQYIPFRKGFIQANLPVEEYDKRVLEATSQSKLKSSPLTGGA